MSVAIETTVGDIIVDLYLDERPRTCLNFLKLCKIKYYNFCLFHKIQRNFIAQSGDPSGTGRSGESVFEQLYGEQAKYFDSEFKPRIKHKKLGALSMVNNGNNMNGSQFFITLGEDLTYLDDEHSVFGEVAEGFEILVKLNDTICDANNRPYQDIRITHTVILHDPYDDPQNLRIPSMSPIPTDEILASDYVRADEDIDDNEGKTIEEIEEEIKDKEAKARATILEMVGDIPDADVRPPENVLFVCKLNPVTTDEDLEIIFSRFGVIKSCEVIKDKKTDESLQYAFIEFEREEDCETAYFKMDNVLIDDRRIHVDFSQSVAKLKFDKNNRPIIEDKRQPRKETLAIKDTSRKTGNYEMIFDSDSSEKVKHKKKKKKSAKKYSSSSEEESSPTLSKRYQNSKEKFSHSSYDSSKRHSEVYRSRSPPSYSRRNDNRSEKSRSSHYSQESNSSNFKNKSSNYYSKDYSPKVERTKSTDYSKKTSSYKHEEKSSHRHSYKYSSSPERRKISHRESSSSPERPKRSEKHSKSSNYSATRSDSHKIKHKSKKYKNDSSGSDDSSNKHSSKYRKHSHRR